MNRLKAFTRMVFQRSSWTALWAPIKSSLNMSRIGDGTRSSVVMAPLQFICRTFPEAPPALWEKDEDNEEEQVSWDHDLLKLLARPNEFYTGRTLWMATLIDYNAGGEAFWLKVRDRAGTVRELWYAPSWTMTPQGDEKKFISHYDYAPSGEPIRLDPTDVVHFRWGIDADEPRRGRSPLKTALKEVYTDEEAAAFTAHLLTNSGVPGIIVSPDGDYQPSPDEAEAVKAKIKSEHSGAGRGEPLVMSGKTRVEQFGFSPEQLNLRHLRHLPEERVCGLLGVPAIVAGFGAGLDRSTFSNYAEAREAAYEDNIIPTQDVLAEEIRFQLLPDFEEDPWSFRFGFDRSKVRVLQEDENKKAERYRGLFKDGVITRSEAKRPLQLDVEDSDDVYLIPVNLIEVPKGESMEESVQPSEEEEPPPEPILTPEELLARAAAEQGEEAPKMKYLKATRAQTRLIFALERDALRLAAVFTDDLTDYFEDLGEEAAKLYRKQTQADALLEAPKANGSDPQKKQTEEQTVERILTVMGLDAWSDAKLRKVFETHYDRTGEQTVKTINQLLELGIQLPDHVMRSIVHRGGTRRGLVDLQKQTRAALLRSIAAGRANGEGPLAIARRIRDEVPAGRFTHAGPSYRAKLIARTETKFAQNMSSVQAYREADTVDSVTVFDGRLGDASDEDCQARDGLIVSFDDAEALMAEEHPNGTMSFAPNVGATVREPEGAST